MKSNNVRLVILLAIVCLGLLAASIAFNLQYRGNDTDGRIVASVGIIITLLLYARFKK